MRRCRGFLARTAAAAMGMFLLAGPVLAQDALPSWNDTESKKALLGFVERVAKNGSADFVPPDQRIATFDNDGTLWAEQPLYFQLFFAIDRVKGGLAPQHPEWKDKEPFASLLKGDVKAALAGGEHAILEIVMATPRRDDDRRVRDDRQGLGRNREAPHDRPAVHRDGLPADDRAARPSARQRLQDVHPRPAG